MSADKLVDSTQLDSDLTSVANAIRTKGGTSAQLAFPAGFVTAIGNIPSGGVTPTGTKQISITQNGTTTEDVTNYASAEITVNVSGGGGVGTLPDTYQEVEYIEGNNTGSGPYLKVPYIPANGHIIKGRTYLASKPSNSMLPIDGVNTSDASRLEIGYGHGDGVFYYWSQKTINIIISGLYGTPIDFEAAYLTASPYRKLKVTTQSDEKEVTNTQAYANYTDITNIYVFGKSYLPFSGRIYGISVETESGSKALDLVPCYRKSDNAIGMYDVVRGAFYTNGGSGSFTKGQDVLSAQQSLNVLLVGG